MMLINGRHTEEVRVAIIDDKKALQGYRVAVAESSVERGNIYRGVVANIEPSLDAAFVEYGGPRHGFLTRHDVVEQAYHHQPKGGASIDKVLQKGQPILVQVTRDAAGTKGATLTTNLSLAGRYLVLLPYEDSKGVSRKVEDEDLRRKLREKVKNLVAKDFGFIVRTNAADQTKTDLKADLDQLKRLWKQVADESGRGKGPRLLHDDQDLVIQVLRDHLDSSIKEVVVDDEELLARAERYVAAVMPRTKIELKLYRDRLPLFSRHNLEPQIEAIYRRTIRLPGGGSIVIDHTEALTAIDVNSGKSKGGESQQETARSTNLEAAAEIARQLRLRDIGGLVVVDFIDMRQAKHRQAVEKAMKEAMKQDRARSQVGRISGNGLLEINRQRVGQALQIRTHVTCPTCEGVGRLVNPELVALGLVRRIEARAATGRLARARIALHPDVANAVQNQRRAQLAALERDFGISIMITSRADLDLAGERVEWDAREAPPEPPRPREEQEPRRQREEQEPRPPREEQAARAEEPPGESRSKRRRRRRNRRKPEGKEPRALGATDPPPEPETQESVEKLEAGAAEKLEAGAAEKLEAGAAEKPAEGGRRRGRRRKKKARPSNGAQLSAAPEQDADPAPPPAEEAGEPAPKRRPRRRRRKPAGAAAAPASEPEPAE